MSRVDVASPPVTHPGDAYPLPEVALPQAPQASKMWGRVLLVAWAMLVLFSLDRLALLLMDLWLFESLGFESVFWTNLRMGLILGAVALVLVTLAAAIPAHVHRLPKTSRRRFLQLGLILGILAGYEFGSRFQEFLLAFNAQPFGETEPVFNLDIGFYTFQLPAIETTLRLGVWWAAFAFAVSVVAAYLARPQEPPPEGMGKLLGWVGVVSTRWTRFTLALLAIVWAAKVWFYRYEVPIWDNGSSSISNGAEFIDVTGFFSRINGFTVTALAILFGLGALAVRLGAYHRAATEPRSTLWRRLTVSALIVALLPGAGIDAAFKAVFALREQLKVTPNEPVIQLPYIERHIDATNRGYDTERIEIVPFEPKDSNDPVPDVETILADPAVRNAPLWPGYVSRLEDLIDPQHAERILLTGGDQIVYGPTMDTFKQQEKLRPYYDFLDVDTTRYEVDGNLRMFATGVRELPLLEPQPWLAWWGQQFLLFTHGHGLVAVDVAGQDENGGPIFVSRGIPTESQLDPLKVEDQSVYYGEGAGSMAYTNARRIEELDFPTPQGRATTQFPPGIQAGVNLDSLLKRLVFGWKSRQTLDIVFSELITEETRVHYYRTPLERVERVAPFLYFDTNAFAYAADDGIHWQVNGLTTSDKYPYSRREALGDKSDVRTPQTRPARRVNYVRDSVKVVIDGFKGSVTYYKWADEPVVNTWASIYPDLFTEASEMPADDRAQVQYPVQFFHSQFDDLYIYYHMKEAIEFFNLEDLWDDGDEVVGPILDEGPAITFSIEPYYWIAQTGGSMPSSQEDHQFVMSMMFTPENAINLRAIATVYQQGDDYGKINVLQVPKGKFFPGPEQADAAIDQDALISSQITLWNRLGTEVIRGHTTALVVDGEVIYIEPLFIRSKQNPAPQMKRVAVVFRGEAFVGVTLEEALRAAIAGEPEPPLEGAPDL